MPSILAIHPGAELYGSDRVFLSSVAALAEDHSVRVLVPHDGALVRHLREETSADVSVHAFAVLRRVDFRGLGLVRTLGRTAADLVVACRFLRRFRPDAVYVSTIIAPLWVLAGGLCRIPVVAHVHENEPGLSRLKARLLLVPLLLATALIANSRATANWLSDTFPRLGPRTTVVYNGVPLPAVTGEDGQRPSSGRSVALVLVGRLAERKGQDVAIRALALLRERGVAATLTLVGDVYPGYEGYAEGLRALSSTLGVADSVTFLGFVPDPTLLYVAADIVLVPSRVEPFGNVAVEAQLHRKCVVASDVQGLAEIVQHGETGLLVSPEDPSGLADAIDRLAREPDLRGRLADSGCARARRLFTEDRYADELRRVFSGVHTK